MPAKITGFLQPINLFRETYRLNAGLRPTASALYKIPDMELIPACSVNHGFFLFLGVLKQLAAILLLGIFAFNLLGFRMVAPFLQDQENEKIETALDENRYSDDQLISVRMPINLPYYNNDETFQRINGEAEIGGIEYKYVKCRIYHDSLEILCIPNTAKIIIQEAELNFSLLASDFQPLGSKKDSRPGNKGFQKLLEYEPFALPLLPKQFFNGKAEYLFQHTPFVNTPPLDNAGKPPEAFSCLSI